MAKISNFYKIVQPTPNTVTMQDSQLMDHGYAATSSNTWYRRFIQGSATRMARYNEYNSMDNDVEIARALDIIAEEMTGRNVKTNMPLDIEMITDDGQEIDDTLTITLKSALRHWSEIHGFNDNRLFKIARLMVKFGDCFFKKESNYKKWTWLPSSDVVGAIVDVDDVTKIIAYQIRKGGKQAQDQSKNGFKTIDDPEDYEIVPAERMVVFSINDDMSDAAPFGESILRTVYKTHKQKELLEDAIVIYRIQRAPERRVFYIDVGKMPPNRVKQYLETIKNEIKQRKIPANNHNGTNSVDAIYNPLSTSDDYFFSQRCLALDTHINVVNIGQITLYRMILNHSQGIKQQVLTVHQETGQHLVCDVEWAGITQRNVNVLKIELSNDTFVECTPDHKWIMVDLSEKEAKDLVSGDELSTLDNRIIVKKIIDNNEITNVGCITVKTSDNNHNFLLQSNVFVRNSDGAGNRVEVLPGGQNLGELTDIEYFMDKVLRGLRVPISWMKPGQNNAMFNDGKIGASYVEEQQFAKFVERLQIYVESTIDREFKKFLFASNINVDNTLFNIKLPKPSNYKQYQQAEIDSTLLSIAQSAESIPWMAKRYIASRFLQMDESEILANEQLVKQERGYVLNKDKTLSQVYGQPSEGMGGMGGFGMSEPIGGTSGMSLAGMAEQPEPAPEIPAPTSPAAPEAGV